MHEVLGEIKGSIANLAHLLLDVESRNEINDFAKKLLLGVDITQRSKIWVGEIEIENMKLILPISFLSDLLFYSCNILDFVYIAHTSRGFEVVKSPIKSVVDSKWEEGDQLPSFVYSLLVSSYIQPLLIVDMVRKYADVIDLPMFKSNDYRRPPAIVCTVVKSITFAAAHYLPFYDGKCANLHGHEWEVEVAVKGFINNSTGMVIDFSHVKDILVKNVKDRLDHRMLNLVMENPTAENIAKWILARVELKIGKVIEYVKVKETQTSFALVK